MKRITTIQVVFDIIHDDDVLDSSEVARIAAADACNALVWTDNSDLKRATDDIETPIVVVSSTVLSTGPRP